jgi:hypothetical protein
MSKILEETLCPPCFTCGEDYSNLYLSRKWLDTVECLQAIDSYGVDDQNAMAFLCAIANEVSARIEKIQAKQVCQICGHSPCICSDIASAVAAQTAQPQQTVQPEVTVDFTAESIDLNRLKYIAGIRG